MKVDECTIRKDLLEDNSKQDCHLSIPLERDGDVIYIDYTFPLRYRWLRDTNGFQVMYLKKWWDAQSIDFDFEEQIGISK